jgi:hypothetical protein
VAWEGVRDDTNRSYSACLPEISQRKRKERERDYAMIMRAEREREREEREEQEKPAIFGFVVTRRHTDG